MNYPESIENLIENFKKLPGVGEKSAERYTFAAIEFDIDEIENFAQALKDVKTKVKKCSLCNHLTEHELCSICSDDTRDKKTICVVEDTKNVILFEKLSVFNGIYFVLDGLISPLDGIGPEDLNIDELIKRIKEENISEVILAIKPSIEGETTLLYIQKLLEGMDVVVTRIAHGIPLGADIEYIDSLTLTLALQDRKKIS
ncbi:MAG: recombination protein RecR [Bacilli bacterium]|nr:recombination protein RecR [Bacilli bacterium]